MIFLGSRTTLASTALAFLERYKGCKGPVVTWQMSPMGPRELWPILGPISRPESVAADPLLAPGREGVMQCWAKRG